MVLKRHLNTLIHQCFWVQYRFYCNKMTSLLVPPESVRGMTCLDRSAFTTIVQVPFLKFENIVISKYKPILNKYILKIKNFKSLQIVNNETIAYLNPDVIKIYEDLLESDRDVLSTVYKEFGTKELTLNYYNFHHQVLLKAILPEDVSSPTSFSMIGHILHLNLRDMHLPYKTIIGNIYLDHIPNVKTIINKMDAIDTTYRHFNMEIIAGEKNTITVAKEAGYTYELDFSQVYWNPRLSTERMLLVKMIQPNDVLYDVFAGIGPFAIPAAKKGAKVFANDLNPESYKWLNKNAASNKVKSNFTSFNMDGREFLKTIVKNDMLERRHSNTDGSEHIVMNLPSTAIEFLDVFYKYFNEDEIKEICSQPPIIHVYCFVKVNKEENGHSLAQQFVEEKLGCALQESLVNLHTVRDVSSYKDMFRVSFLLNERILKGEEPAMKKFKSENNSCMSKKDDIIEYNGEEGTTEEPKKEKCIQSSNSS
nr:tRNA (guanine(37)-N1)-methyltransferase isoform X1 [Nomia melanderi]